MRKRIIKRDTEQRAAHTASEPRSLKGNPIPCHYEPETCRKPIELETPSPKRWLFTSIILCGQRCQSRRIPGAGQTPHRVRSPPTQPEIAVAHVGE